MNRQQAIDEAVMCVEPWHKEMLLKLASFMPVRSHFLNEQDLIEAYKNALMRVREEFNRIMHGERGAA